MNSIIHWKHTRSNSHQTFQTLYQMALHGNLRLIFGPLVFCHFKIKAQKPPQNATQL